MFSKSHLALTIGRPLCTNHFLLVLPCPFSLGTPGLYEECRCWWEWKGNCAKCLAPVKRMEGIFCANFCEPRGKWPACRKAWHTGCYKCLGQGKFPVRRIQDKEGNKWYKHDRRVFRINHGVRGKHASIQFQCKICWLINLEGRLPVDGLDEAYVMLVRRANLDAMGGRAVATMEAHATAILRAVRNCQHFRKTPLIPPRGPMPISDGVGMGLAIELLFHSLMAIPRIKGETHIQFDSMRRPRATFASAWELSPMGTEEGSSFSLSTTKISITSCLSQQKWFGLMMRGMESRMGYTSNRQQPLGTGIVSKLLTLIQEEADKQERTVAREYLKVGAAIATAVCASLRGSDVS